MKIGKVKGFFIILAAFLILGIPFKVMVLVEGFTEVRPVNAFPPIAGLIFGPLGAFACGISNLIADLFGTFNATSLLGFFANMLAAYMPYRLWHIYSDEAPNSHKNKNIVKYVFICLAAALSAAWFLSFGLFYFFEQWMEQIYTYVFMNNFGFSLGLGLPLFIILSSNDINIKCAEKPKHYILLKNKKSRFIVPIVYTAVMLMVLFGVCFLHLSPLEQPWLNALSVLGLAGMLLIVI